MIRGSSELQRRCFRSAIKVAVPTDGLYQEQTETRHQSRRMERGKWRCRGAEHRHYETWNRNSARVPHEYVLDVKGVITWKYLPRLGVRVADEIVRVCARARAHTHTRKRRVACAMACIHTTHYETCVCEYAFARTSPVFERKELLPRWVEVTASDFDACGTVLRIPRICDTLGVPQSADENVDP